MNGISTSKGQEKDASSACIRDIFLHENKSLKKLRLYISGKNALKTDVKEKLLIYPNMVEIRQTNPLKQSGNKAGGKDIIKEFSKKSRREFIKFLCKITDKLNLWQDLTFADDVMQNKSERKEVSNKSLNRFRRKVLERYPSVKIAYKREWVSRKSGNLKGEHIPHYHMFISVPDMSEDYELLNLAPDLARTWVGCTKTKEIYKSLSVALHSKSYRIINSQKQAIKYATKYITKPNENWTEESIGRSWGTIGKFDIPEPLEIEMTPAEMVHVRRRLRKIAPKKHFMQKALKQKETPTFVITTEETVKRIIKNTKYLLGNECRNFFETKRG